MNSNNSIQVFTYENNNVRTVERDGEVWFVAQDVCDVLGLTNTTEAIKSLDDDEKMTLSFSESHSGKRGGAQKINIISESGLYGLIMRSNKPEAKKFSRWVHHEVLPQIIKNGTYSVHAIDSAEIKKIQETHSEIKELLKRFYFWDAIDSALEKTCYTLRTEQEKLSHKDIPFPPHIDMEDICILETILQSATIQVKHKLRALTNKIGLLRKLLNTQED